MRHGRPRARAVALAAALLAAGCSRQPSPPAAPPGDAAAAPPGLLLITVDALRRDHLGCYGYRRATSPHLDRLAARGVRFDAAVAQGSWIFSALPSLLTSRYPTDHVDLWLEPAGRPGMGVGRITPDARTLAQELRGRGYRTSVVGGNPALGMIVGLRRGFRSAEIGDLRAAEVTDRAIARLRGAGAAPFFLWVHYMDPHAPYAPPPPFAERFARDGVGATGKVLPLLEASYLGAGGIPRLAAVEGHRELDYYVARYDGEIAYVDQEIGRLLAALQDLRLEARTLVAVSADHGESLGEQELYFSHVYNLHAAIVDVPLILAWPGRLAPRVVAQPVMAVDLVPTVVELLGARPPDPRWVGRSLAACAVGAACPAPEAYATRGIEVAVRTPGWKAICSAPALDRCTLHEVARDPLEARDVATAHPRVLAELRDRLAAFVRAHPDPRPRSPAGILVEPDPDTKAALESLGYVRP